MAKHSTHTATLTLHGVRPVNHQSGAEAARDLMTQVTALQKASACNVYVCNSRVTLAP